MAIVCCVSAAAATTAVAVDPGNLFSSFQPMVNVCVSVRLHAKAPAIYIVATADSKQKHKNVAPQLPNPNNTHCMQFDGTREAKSYMSKC